MYAPGDGLPLRGAGGAARLGRGVGGSPEDWERPAAIKKFMGGPIKAGII